MTDQHISQPSSTNVAQIQRISARQKVVGGIPVNRVIPVRERRLIGAWCFLDHAGPTIFKGDAEGMRVAPHPHIGLQTFTWMLQGEVLHRDSLGYEQVIRPGQVNLMTAGHGIAHSEDSFGSEKRLHAAQLWIALPAAIKEMPPRFDHYPHLPSWAEGACRYTFLMGDYASYHAPTLHFSPLMGLDIQTSKRVTLTLKLDASFEYGIAVLQGEIAIESLYFRTNELAYWGVGSQTITLTLSDNAHLLLLGGEPLNEEVLMWWNFVGRNREEIQKAVTCWNAGSDRFGRVFNDNRTPTPAPQMP